MNRAAIDAWLQQLDEGFVLGWSNRGLLRRGSSLLAQSEPGTLTWSSEHGYRLALEQHQQSLSGPGFEHLHCSCPANGACHHAVAALLHWMAQMAAPKRAPDEVPAIADSGPDAVLAIVDAPTVRTPPIWLSADWPALAKALGAAALRKAGEWQNQGIGVQVEAADLHLQGRIELEPIVRLRLNASGGLAAALCDCGQRRCAHLAALILQARAEAGLAPPTLPGATVSSAQAAVLTALEAWCVQLAQIGSAQLSTATLEQARALSTRSRQAELPAVSTAMQPLLRWLEDELAGRSRARPEALLSALGPLWARLRALKSQPLPQPLIELGGRHRRVFRSAPTLELAILAVEAWSHEDGGEGLNLHAWCDLSRRWWRLPLMQTVAMRGFEASLLRHWRQQTWAGCELGQLLGGCQRLEGAWCSDDGSLSARAQTRWQDIDGLPGAVSAQQAPVTPVAAPTGTEAPGQGAAEIAEAAVRLRDLRAEALQSRLPAPMDCAQLARLLRDSAERGGLKGRAPVVLAGPFESEAPQFDRVQQCWTQRLIDAHGRSVQLQIEPNDATRRRAIRALQQAWDSRQRWRCVLGRLSHQDGCMTLEPIALQSTEDATWHSPGMV
jgi:hypothetical protein